MPDVANPEVMKELLRQRGLLAEGGNIRSLPFANPASGNIGSGQALTGQPTSDVAQALAGVPSGIPATDINGNPVVVDPANSDPSIVDSLPDSELNRLLPLLTGAAGAGLAMLIKNKLGNRAAVVDPLAPLPPAASTRGAGAAGNASDIIDGEFTEVPNAAQLEANGTKALPAPNPALEGPRNRVSDEGTPPKYLTSRELAKRKGANLPIDISTNGPPIVGGDAMSDLDDADMTKALMVTKRLIADRVAGRNRKYVQGKEGIGRKGLPTGELDKESVLNVVVKAIRDAKAANALRKVVR